MNLLFRFALHLIRATLSGQRIAPLGESVVRLRVLPNDVDFNRHLNNGRYLSMMDLGRLDLVARSGLLREMIRHRWRPVVGAATIRFRRSLGTFQRFVIRSRIVGWDEKWLYFEQRFERHGELYAIALVRVAVRSGGFTLDPSVTLRAAGCDAPPPPLSDAIRQWNLALDTVSAGARPGS